MAGPHTNRGAKRARECRTELGLEPDAPLPCLLKIVEERLGVPVTISDLPEGVEGQCWQLDGTRVFFVKGHPTFWPRTRFTLAHELGHLRCGHDGHLPTESTYTTLGGKVTSTVEIEANAFAAEFLAPAAAVREVVGDDEVTMDHLVRLSGRYGISPIAAAHRCTTLGLLAHDDPLKAAALDADAQRQAWDAFEGERYADGISALGEDGLPRLSPTLGDGPLAALLRGDTELEAVAKDFGVAPAVLAYHLQRLGF